MEFEITNEDAGDTREVDPFASTLPNGNILVGWTQFAASQTNGRSTGLRIIQPDGTPVTGEFFPAGLNPTGDRIDPEIVVISDTKFILIETEFFFNDLGGGVFEFGFDIFGRVITESGGTLSSGPQVDLTPAGFASNGNVDVTMTDNGNIVVASDLTDDLIGNTDPIVSVAVLDQNLNILTDFTQVSERDTSSPSGITIDAVGNDVAVSWTQNSTDGLTIPLLGQTVTINSDGSIAPFVRTDHVLRSGESFGLRDMATLANGNILVLSNGGPEPDTGSGDSGDSDRLFGTVFNSDFTSVVQSTFRIDQIDSDFGIAGAHIVPLAGGGFFVAFSRALNADGSNPNFEIWYRVYDNSYAANGNEVRLTNQTMDISDVSPEATLLSSDGDVLVTWHQGPRLTSSEDVFGIVLNNLDPNPPSTNMAPVVDLNGGGGGVNNTAAFTEATHQGLGAGNGIQIAPTGTLSDPDAGDNVDTVTFTLTNDQNGALEQLFVDPAALTGGVTVTGNSSDTLTLSRNSATQAQLQTALQAVRWQNNSDDPSTTSRIINVVANDGDTDSATAVATITVAASNDAPVIAGDLMADVDEGGTVTIATADLTEADPDDSGTGLTYTVTGTSNGQVELSTAANVAVTMFTQDDLANNRVVFRHDGSETLTADFSVTLADGGEDGAGSAGPETVNLTVSPVNDAPVISGDLASTVDEGGVVTITTADLTENDPDDSGTGLTYTVTGTVNGQVELSTAANVAVTMFTQDDLDNDRVVFRHDDSQTSTASFTVTLADGGEDGVGTAGPETVNLTVTAINDAPEAIGVPASVTVVEDVATAVDLSAITFSDSDSGMADIAFTVQASEGVLTAADAGGVTVGGSGTAILVLTGTASEIDAYLNNGAAIEYTTSLNDAGMPGASLTIFANDGGNTGSGGGIDTLLGLVDINITPVNDSPVIAGDLDATVSEGGTVTITTADLTEADPDDAGTGLTYMVTGTTNGQVELSTAANVAVTMFTQDDLDNDRVVFRHDGSETTAADFSVTLADGGEDGAATAGPSTVAVTVTPVDDPANAQNDAFATDEATVIGAGLNVFNANPTTADSDVDSPLTVTQVNGVAGDVGSQVTLASGALLTLNANGTFAYDPNGAFDALAGPGSGATNLADTDSFSYQLNGDDTATVTIDIAGLDSSGDVLIGTAGNDTLNGGMGADTLRGLGGNDQYVVSGDDIVDESVPGSGGFNAVLSLNTINLTDASLFLGVISAATVYGSANVNVIGNSFGNILTGNSGSNVINGQAGADTMRGLGGNDTYVVDNAGDIVDESVAGSSGADRVLSSVDVDLTDGARFRGAIERVELQGSANIDATGNVLANALIGNSGDNVLDGGLGNDRLTGGSGSDSFTFSTMPMAGNVDTITDFTVGQDSIALDDAIFAALGPSVTADEFRTLGLGGGQDANDFLLYNDTNGALFYDADANGAGSAVLITVVDPMTGLSATDITIV